jgi:CheY-like chemotaxis protein
MVNMNAVSIREPVSAELTSFDALSRRQLMCRDVSFRTTINADGRVQADRRALRVLLVSGQNPDPVNERVELARRLGHTVLQATDGFVALRLAVAYQPDVVLLDCGLTLSDSCQIARHLRFDYPRKDVWIIAVTVRMDAESRKSCIDAGIDVLITKPLDPDVLEALLMLEYGRLNRSATDVAAAHAGQGFVPNCWGDNVN